MSSFFQSTPNYCMSKDKQRASRGLLQSAKISTDRTKSHMDFKSSTEDAEEKFAEELAVQFLEARSEEDDDLPAPIERYTKFISHRWGTISRDDYHPNQRQTSGNAPCVLASSLKTSP